MARYEFAREILLGKEGDQGDQGTAAFVMELDSDVEQLGSAANTSLRDNVAAIRQRVVELVDIMELMRPPDFDFAAMAAQCEGPQDNYAGLAYGFNATRRCGSLAVDEEVRRGCTLVIQSPEPPVAPADGPQA